jgi:hypothetical protein
MRIKPDIDQAVILREAGYTLASITQKTGLSGSTLYRAFTKLDVTRGTTTKNTLDSAKQALLEQSGLVGDLKQLIASQINDDLSLSTQIRAGITIAINDLINDVTTPASLKARSYSAMATTLKLTSDIMRRALQIDDATLSVTEIPTLKIIKMTDKDIEDVRNRFNDDQDDDSIYDDDLILTTD